jgi:hypothetical protein
MTVSLRPATSELVEYTIRPGLANLVFDDLGALSADFGGEIEIRLLRNPEAETLEPTVGSSPLTNAMSRVVAAVREAEQRPLRQAGRELLDGDGYRFAVDLPLDDLFANDIGAEVPEARARVRVKRIGTTLGRLWLMEFKVAPITFATDRGDTVMMRHEGFALLSEDQNTLVAGGTQYRGQVAEADTGALVPYEGRRLYGLAPDPEQPTAVFDATGLADVRTLINSFGDPADLAAAAEGDLTDDVERLAVVPTEGEAIEQIRQATVPRWLGVVRDVAVGLDVLGATAAEAQANPLPMMALASIPTTIDPLMAFGTDAFDTIKNDDETRLDWSGGLSALTGNAVLAFDANGNELASAVEVLGAATDPQLAGPALAAATAIDFEDATFASFAAAASRRGGFTEADLRPERARPEPAVFRRTWIGTSLDTLGVALLQPGGLSSLDPEAAEALSSGVESFNTQQTTLSATDPGAGLSTAYNSRQSLAVTNAVTRDPTFTAASSRLVTTNGTLFTGGGGVTGVAGTGLVGGTSTGNFTNVVTELPFEFSIFDGQVTDGDIVDLFVVDRRGNIVISEQDVLLPNRSEALTFAPVIEPGRIEIQLVAQNLGDSGGNTGTILVNSPIIAGSQEQNFVLGVGEAGVLVVEAEAR